VRNLILTAAGFLCLAGASYSLNTAWGWPEKQKDPADEAPHRIGLIDITYVFSNYEKLKYEREDFVVVLKEAQAAYRNKQQKAQELQEELNKFTPDSPEFETRRNRLIKMSNELATEKKMMEMDFAKKEAKIYHAAYLEIQDAVERFCDRYRFTVIMSFTRNDPSSTDPRRVNQLLSQPIVYHRKRDDLSQGVLDYLNQKYLKSAGGEARPVSDGKSAPAAPKSAKKDDKLKPAVGTDR
jgi:Skp family chaperone for outer membrane proteins